MTAPTTHRWTPRRKLAVVRSIREGEVSPADVIAAHGLSEEELTSWLSRAERFGQRGLSIGSLQELPR